MRRKLSALGDVMQSATMQSVALTNDMLEINASHNDRKGETVQ